MNRRPMRSGLLLALIPVLAACAAGANPPVQDVEPRHPSGQVGPVKVRSLMILTAPDSGAGAAVVTLVNTGDEPETLESLQIGEVGETAGQQLEVPAGITVPAGRAVNVGTPDGPSLRIDDLDRVATGGFVAVTMIFDKAGRLTLNALIQEATGPYESFFPTPSAPSPTPATSISPSPTPSATSSPSPTPTS